MVAMMDRLFPALMMLGLFSPIAAVVGACVVYARHRHRIAPERRVPVIGYALATLGCGVLGGILGLVFGIKVACHGPNAGNLCGLWGFFVTGPIALAVATLPVMIGVAAIRPASKLQSGDRN